MPKFRLMTFPFKKHLLLMGVTLALMISYCAIFGNFFPNINNQIGSDYSYFLPMLLDGYFWYHTNGFWKIPWFTPSFCGGSLNYVNVQSCYYTLPQLFTLFSDPLSAVHLTFILFAGLGLFGFYLLLRRAFLISRPASILGAGLFLFNGFYAHRMLIGHFADHSFMLLPFILFVLLRPLPEGTKARIRRFLLDAVIGGSLFAYMVQSGFGPYLIPIIITTSSIGLIHGILYGRQFDFWLRWAGAGFTSVLLCASKLTTVYYLMSNFSRSAYKLPGAKNFLSAAWLMLKSLFISPSLDPHRTEMLTNLQWEIERHEWEYSVTIIPLLILLYGTYRIFRQMQIKDRVLKFNRKQLIQIVAVSILLIIPVAVNTYSPAWNAFLKQLPIIKSASNLIRWFVVYVPIVVLATALVFEKLSASSKYQWRIVFIALAAVVAINAFTDRGTYLRWGYDYEEIVDSYFVVKAGLWKPKIKTIGINVDKNGHIKILIKKNNLLIHGASQLYCYEALFGYRLEDFPVKTLHPGPVLEEKQGLLNIKDPACYVWPQANNCQPGDHFTAEQKDAVEAFVNYRPFPFQIPFIQKIANWINALALVVTLVFLLLYAVRGLVHLAGKTDDFL